MSTLLDALTFMHGPAMTNRFRLSPLAGVFLAVTVGARLTASQPLRGRAVRPRRVAVAAEVPPGVGAGVAGQE